MKKEKQIGIRVGVPAFFALELENVYRHTEGAHRALAFADFVGLLVGLGLEQYRQGNAPAPIGERESQEDIKDGEEAPEDIHLFDINPAGLHDLFRDFDEAPEGRPLDIKPRLRLVREEEFA